MDEPGLLTVSDALISHYISRVPLGAASCDTEAELAEGKAAKQTESVRPSLLTLYAQAYSEIIISGEVTLSISENSNSRCSALSTSASLSDPHSQARGKPALLITNKSS